MHTTNFQSGMMITRLFKRKRINIQRLCHIGLVLFLFMCAQGLLVKNLNGQAYQEFVAEQQRSINARYRIGPFALLPRFTFNLGYDNNVFRRPYPEEAVGDYVLRTGVPFDVYLLSGNWMVFSLKTVPEYVYYIQTRAHQDWNYSISPTLTMVLINRFVLSGSYMNSKIWRRPTNEFDIPTFEKRKAYLVSLSYDPGRTISLGIQYQDIKTKHDEEIYARRMDRRSKEALLRATYRIAQEKYFFIQGRYIETAFIDVDSRDRDGLSYDVNAGIIFPLLARLTGTLSLGYGEYVPNDPEQKAFSGWLGDTALQYSISRFRLRIRYGRSLEFSLGSQNFFINEGIGGGASVFLHPLPLRLGYDFAYGSADYPDGRSDIYRNHSGRIVLRVVRNIGVGVNLAYWERQSAITGLNRHSTYVFIYIDYAYDF